MAKLNTKAGFSIIEILLSGTLFALMVTALIGAFIYAQANTKNVGLHNHAVFLAEEGLEAVRNIADADYNNLVDGVYGLSLDNNRFVFIEGSDNVEIFSRQITIAEVAPNIKQITANVSWQDNQVNASTYLTNFRGQ